jgi:ankyrin repeat protein
MTTPFSIDFVFSDNFDELKKLSIDELKECDDMGRNVFHAVCSRQKPDMLKYLIEKLGSDSKLLVNSRDNKGHTPT